VPFFDTNGNGQQDAGEKSYLDIELMNLNRRPLKLYRPVVNADRISMRVAPGKYLLDFDPSGFPPNWRTQATGYTVEVAAGSYTKVLVPLKPSYNIEGVVRDVDGKPIVGAKVELTPSNGGDKVFSISSRDGSFYLESIGQGSYQLQVNGKVVAPAVINLNSSSPLSQTFNLQMAD
jgi:Carboxypeptidase regulatory-like domain